MVSPAVRNNAILFCKRFDLIFPRPVITETSMNKNNGMAPADIGRVVGCTAQAVRNAIRAFDADGLGCLAAKSHARKDPGRVWDRVHDDDLEDLLHRRPREFGKATSLWTLALVAEVCKDKGWTPRALSVEAVRQALKRLGVGWKRAKHWITSPDPEYAEKKSCGTG